MSELLYIVLHCGSPSSCGNFFNSPALRLAGTSCCRRQHLLLHDVHRKPSLTCPKRMWRKRTAAIIISVFDNFLVFDCEEIFLPYSCYCYWCLVLTDQDSNTCTQLEDTPPLHDCICTVHVVRSLNFNTNTSTTLTSQVEIFIKKSYKNSYMFRSTTISRELQYPR